MIVPEIIEKDKEFVQRIPFRDFYTAYETSRIMGVAPPSVYKSIKRGGLPGVTVDGKVMVRHVDLVTYIRKRSRETIPDGVLVEPIIPDEVAPWAETLASRMPQPNDQIIEVIESGVLDFLDA